MINPTSARGDLERLNTTSVNDGRWREASTFSDDVPCKVNDAEDRVLIRAPRDFIDLISAEDCLDDWRSGVFSVVSSTASSSSGKMFSCDWYILGTSAGLKFQMIASLRSMMRSRPSRSTTVQISPKMKGARKPMREYKAPPTGGPIISL